MVRVLYHRGHVVQKLNLCKSNIYRGFLVLFGQYFGQNNCTTHIAQFFISKILIQKSPDQGMIRANKMYRLIQKCTKRKL